MYRFSLARAAAPLSLALSLLALAATPLAAAAPSGPPRLIADVSDSTFDLVDEVQILGRFGDHVYFGGGGPVYGNTLWRTDGTAAGTEPVADLCPGPCGPTSLLDFAAGDTRAYFVTWHYRFVEVFYEVWTTDGTREGTERLLRLLGPAATVREVETVGDHLFFSAGDVAGPPGVELWTSDGTAAGTRLFADLCPGECESAPEELVAYGGELFFSARLPETGRELWKADPAAGTVEMVRDICPGDCGHASDLAVVDGLLYFQAFQPATGSEPWVSDGTAAGTRLLVDARPGTESGALDTVFSAGGTVYLALDNAPFGVAKLFRTDGTPAGTVPASEVDDALRNHLLLGFASPTPSGLVYFASRTDPDGPPGATFRVFDPATHEVRDLREGLMFEFGSLGDQIRPESDTIVFGASERGIGNEPWVSDGTPAGTRQLADVRPGDIGSDASGFTAVGDHVVFAAHDEILAFHLWTTDRTPEGTARVPLDPASPSFPFSLTSYAGRLWFSARPHGIGERELWRTTADGTGAEPVAPGVPAGEITIAGSKLFFRGERGLPMTLAPPGLEPVVLAHSQPAREFTLGPGGLVYFGTHGYGEELYATDGTPDGTRLVTDVDPEWFDPCTTDDVCPPAQALVAERYPDQLTSFGGYLYFTAVPPESSFRAGLFRSDGTGAGTEWLSEVPLGVRTIVSLGNRIVFDAGQEGRQIWTLAPGESPHALTGVGSFQTGGLAGVNGVAYYFAEVARTVELHRTAGTSATSRTVAVIQGATRLEDVGEIVGVGSRLFFPVYTPETGTELWSSDGTAAGTGLLIDLRPGRGDSNPTGLTAVGSHLLFAADDGETGHEPWVTDGTAAGTVRLADLAPGPRPSSPDEFTRVGSSIYFAADDGSGRGRELWAIDAGGAGNGSAPGGVPDDAVGIVAPEYPDFRFWVRITAGGPGGSIQPARRELLCIPETVCVSGALPGRSELFLRIVGPRPNGFLWPTLVRFSTSRIEVWIEQVSTGVLQHYVLDAAAPGSSDLDGLFDRRGFRAD